ncbi:MULTISPECIES: NUDIX hydrolase [Bacillus amyloliquefaciens group]|uniref:NUDIX hydrolase n=1 Tax=Bacillus amyloliquefaciens group TaxID=1938374 RepID=UPI00073CCBAC|nr:MULTISPECIES: NUDIX hydrolase [Bacillus amyloliquefaciens group]APH47739.1 DNA mismatch repair protein MutT [Bacillus amyloliquefaciens]KTF60364.1 DNA mismatch repair protein MutT [Bacillus amyloliquefaciens]MDM5203912.1 NUDIX hydrolase [Bacillus velezensis]QHC10580.1 NUDIX domain-containing protein [Bacillus velezensis]ULR35692.1 NUDIX hydrolase [Bacillus velezensis]
MAQGAFVIIQNEERDILLVKRKDVPLWDLPGGGIEEGETPEAAAVREAFEETGYNVTILQKSGEYERPAFEDTQHVFIGAITGGTPLMNGPETAALRWFPPNRRPLFMVPNRRRQVKDGLNGAANRKTVLKDRNLLSILDLLRKKLRV